MIPRPSGIFGCEYRFLLPPLPTKPKNGFAGTPFCLIFQKRGVFVFVVLIRTVVLYLFIVIGIRLLGKHQIGQLEPSELVLR